MTIFKCSIHTVGALLAGLFAAQAAVAQIGPTRDDRLVCGQTSHFFYDNGSGVQQPAVVTSSFDLQPGLALWARRRGYDYYKARSDMGAASMQNNPYFQSSGNSGTMPVEGLRYIVVHPLAAAPQGIDDAGLYLGDGTPALPDLWDGMTFRIDFLNDAFEVGLSYVADGRITLTGSSSGTALQPGVTNTYIFSTLGGPLRPMIPVAWGGSAPPSGSLYLQDITFTTTLVPSPSAAAILGLAGLVAVRRRRL